MTLKLRLTTLLVLSILACNVSVAREWPEGIRAEISSCTHTTSFGSVYPRVKGRLILDAKLNWPKMMIGARVSIQSDTGVRELTASSHFTDFSGAFGSESFVVPFDAADKLSDSERILSCDAFFVEGTRITTIKAIVTHKDTPVADTIGCFKDLVAATEAEGVEARKRLADLLRYGCVTFAPEGYYTRDPQPFSTSGPANKKLSGVMVTLLKPYIARTGPVAVIGYTLPVYLTKGEASVMEDQ